MLRNGNPSVNFETLDFTHLHDLYRWKFVQAMSNNGVYWSEFANILDIQFHEFLYIVDKYNDGSMSGSVAACVYTVRVCASSMC